MEIYAENKKALFNYEIIEKYEAGLVLLGHEVKSIKAGHITLSGSYIVIRAGATDNAEPFIIGSKVPAYQPKNTPDSYNPERLRKILLNKKEINYLMGKVNERGFSLVPLKVYQQNGRIKLEFALAKGQKKFDKKEKIKKRDTNREINRLLSKS